MHYVYANGVEVCEMDAKLVAPPKVGWWRYAIYRLYRWAWNPIYNKRPELMVPIAEEFSQMAIDKLGAQRYLECREWWKEVKESHEGP